VCNIWWVPTPALPFGVHADNTLKGLLLIDRGITRVLSKIHQIKKLVFLIDKDESISLY